LAWFLFIEQHKEFELMKLSKITSPETLNRAITKAYCFVCCGTSWSIPCRKQYSILERLAKAHDGRDCIVVLDIEKHPDTATILSIQSIPTTIVFSNGKETGRLVGLRSYPKLRIALSRVVPSASANQCKGQVATMKYREGNV
jgi:thioredoxin 1